MPRVFNQRNEWVAALENATNIGYTPVYNDLWSARFTLPADDPKNEYCQPFNYVEIFDGQKRVELFRIKGEDFTRVRQGFRTYTCEHVIITLLDDILFKFHQIGNIGVFTPEVIAYILRFQTTQNWRLGRCDFRHQFLYKWESENLLAALFSVPRQFAGQWHFTYDTTSYPWTVNLVHAQAEIGCEIRRRKNMQGITKKTCVKNLVTRLWPLGYGEGDNQLTIASVNGGREFIDADTMPLYGVKQGIWTDRRFENAQNLMETARVMLEEIKHPYITYEVESIDLFQRTGDAFDEMAEGKLVRVIDRADDIDVDTRIVKIDKPDVTKADIKITLANRDRNVAGSIAALQERARINDTYAQGAETQIPMTFIDNAEPNFPAVFEFFLPASMVNINEARLRVQLLPFRTFSRAIRGGGGSTQTSTAGGGTTTSTTAGGGMTESTTSGGGMTESTTSGGGTAATTSTTNTQSPTTEFAGAEVRATTQEAQRTPAVPVTDATEGTSADSVWGGATTSGMDATSLDGDPPHAHRVTLGHTHRITIPGHTHIIIIPAHGHNVDIPGHSHRVTIPGHSHSVTIDAHSHSVTIPSHSHSVTIPAHSHSVTISAHQHNITIPDHSHEIEFGIFTGASAQSVSIRVDGTTVPIVGGLDNINIIPFLRRDGGGRIARNTWHRLELVPDRLTRISASIFLTIFTNSRGGETL